MVILCNNILYFFDAELQKLHLQSPDLTDDSIFFAILHMHDLKELSIERSDVSNSTFLTA